MTALSIIMRVAGGLGEVDMAASHVAMQYMLLIALGMDGFAHATEALAGSAWGEGKADLFRRWVRLTSLWTFAASIIYALLFWFAVNGITALLTDLPSVRESVASIMPLIVALPMVAVACYQFDGVYIAATAGAGMMVTMAIAFVVFILALLPMTYAWGLAGVWGAVLLFMAVRGITQAAWYPRLESQLEKQVE